MRTEGLKMGIERGDIFECVNKRLQYDGKFVVISNVCAALAVGCEVAYPGDGVGCAAQIVYAQMDRAEAAEARAEAAEARLAEVESERDAAVEAAAVEFRNYQAATARAAPAYAALKRQHENIQRWLETGEPASAEESKSIADQIAAALELAKEPQG